MFKVLDRKTGSLYLQSPELIIFPGMELSIFREHTNRVLNFQSHSLEWEIAFLSDVRLCGRSFSLMAAGCSKRLMQIRLALSHTSMPVIEQQLLYVRCIREHLGRGPFRYRWGRVVVCCNCRFSDPEILIVFGKAS